MPRYPEPDQREQHHRIASPLMSYAEFLTCPSCGNQMPLKTEGLEWIVRSPRDVTDRLLARYSRQETEHLIVLSLDTKNRVKDETLVYVGSINQALVRVGELFTEPIRQHAAGLILVHNHPSGDATPSPDDLHLTAEVLAAAKLLDFDLLDHIVLGNGSYVSLRDRGVVFSR
jgi:DNA repair protein RadC